MEEVSSTNIPKPSLAFIAMVCSDPPAGRAQCTVRLVAEDAVKRRLVPRVGRETIRVLLLHHDLKPWREKKCRVRPNEEAPESPASHAGAGQTPDSSLVHSVPSIANAAGTWGIGHVTGFEPW